MVKFEVAVSCLNDDIFKILSNFKNLLGVNEVNVHIIHQINNGKNYSSMIDELSVYNNVRYSHLSSIGLPNSRNYALENCKAEYLIPTDSDVILFTDSFNIVLKYFEEDEELDYITLKSFYDLEKNKPRRSFDKDKKIHTRRSLLSVSSIEIVLKVKSFIDEEVKWDPDFGLGAKFSGGLETVMLQNAFKSNLKGLYIPVPLCCHHELSSGEEISLKRVFIRSAVFEKIFGKIGGKFLSFIFYVKNFKKYRKLGFINILEAIWSNKNI